MASGNDLPFWTQENGVFPVFPGEPEGDSSFSAMNGPKTVKVNSSLILMSTAGIEVCPFQERERKTYNFGVFMSPLLPSHVSGLESLPFTPFSTPEDIYWSHKASASCQRVDGSSWEVA